MLNKLLTMKRHLLFLGMLSVVMFSFLFASCENKEINPELSTDAPGELIFSADGGITLPGATGPTYAPVFTVTTNVPEGWDITLDPANGGNWLSVSAKTHNTFTLTATANEMAADRENVIITITSGKASPVTITSKQLTTTANLSVTPVISGDLVFNADGTVILPNANEPTGAPLFTVTTNAPDGWNVVLDPADGRDWLSVSARTNDTFTLSAAVNNSGSDREAVTVRVSSGDASVEIRATQSNSSQNIISSLADLIWLSEQVNGGNSFEGEQFVQTADIDMEDYDFTPIGSVGNPFKGSYNGNGYTISNLLIELPDDDNCGLFGFVGRGGALSNIGIASGLVWGFQNIGGVCGYNDGGTITGCYNEGCEVVGYAAIGGVCGYNDGGTITGCHNNGEPHGSYFVGGVCGTNLNGTLTESYNTGWVYSQHNSGGVCGRNAGSASIISNCHNIGKIDGSGYSAGICAWNDGANIIACRNEGTISGYSSVSGVCGSNNGTITDCYNTGDISGTSHQVGGISGYNHSGIITSCYNTGAVSGNEKVGGVCGENYGTIALITDCRNEGTVSGNLAVGGVSGSNTFATLTNSYNIGIITGYCNAGGICGHNYYASITACSNTGTVSGEVNIGGVCGWSDYYSTVAGSYNTGTVSGNLAIGGVCGRNVYSTVSSSYNTGPVSGTKQIGGVCGVSDGLENLVSGCYNTGMVSGTTDVGGVCGMVETWSTITACYWLKYDDGAQYGLGTFSTDTDATPFGDTSWPTASMSGWGVTANNGTDGNYWKALSPDRLGKWLAGGSPAGVNSVFPKLYFE